MYILYTITTYMSTDSSYLTLLNFAQLTTVD